jgi:multiple sugar transport system substrate-binding protein
VKELPKNYTWDDLIDIAHKNDSSIEVQAARYEGYTVWINSLIASAGGSLVDENGDVKVDDTAKRAAEIVKRVADEAAPEGMSNNKEDQARLGFESGRSDFAVNYTFVWASAGELPGDFQKNMGFARYPRVDRDKPSKVTLGGINLGIGAYSKHPDLAFEAAQCLAKPENQIAAAELGGLAPTTESLYDDPKVKKAFPFGDLMRSSLDEGVPRPVNPAYADISLAIQKTYHPPDGIDPDSVIGDLEDKLDKAAEGKIF